MNSEDNFPVHIEMRKKIRISYQTTYHTWCLFRSARSQFWPQNEHWTTSGISLKKEFNRNCEHWRNLLKSSSRIIWFSWTICVGWRCLSLVFSMCDGDEDSNGLLRWDADGDGSNPVDIVLTKSLDSSMLAQLFS